MNKIAVKILLAILSLCISIFIAEKLVGKFRHQTTYTEAYDSYNCYQKDDLLPFSLSRGKVCHMTSYSQDITINNNSLGFRGVEFAFGKNKGTTRILALGDSITFGVGLKDGETYPEQLEKVYKVLTAMKEITQKEGTQFMVVLIPLDHQLNPQKYNFWFIDPNNLDFIQKRLGKAFGERGIKYLDLYPVFDKARDRGSPRPAFQCPWPKDNCGVYSGLFSSERMG